MNWNYTQKYLIVADYEYHNTLLNYKNKEPRLNYKVITKDQLLDLLSFSYVKDPIPMLLQERKYDYSKLKKLLRVLRVADRSKSQELTQLKERLEAAGYLSYDELGKYELSQKQILLFEADEDEELKHILERNSLSFDELHFVDIGYQKTYQKQPNLFLFPDKLTQYFAIFSDMRRRIVEEQENPERFVLFVNSDDCYYLSLLSDLFKLDAKIVVEKPLISDDQVKQAINQFYQNKNFTYSGEVKDNTSLAKLMQLVDFYHLQDIADFGFAYSNLMEILTGNQQIDYVNEKGVTCTNRLSFDDNQYYITDFVFGTFYKVYDDNNVFEDAFLEELGCNTSYVQTNMDKRKKLNYLTYNRVLSASRVKLHLGDKIFDSQFLKENDWELHKTDFQEDGYYTKEALALMKSKFKDDARYPSDGEYKSYDHSYQKASVPFPEHNSVSALKSFYHCPFAYFCERVLKLNDHDTNHDWFDASFGVLVHKVFEHIYDVNFDFDQAFSEGVEAFKKDYEKKKCEFTPKDEAWINNAKEDVRVYAKAIHEQISHATIEKELAEQEIHFTLHSEATHRDYPFIGYIDKLVYSKGDSGDNYFTVVDYKTGSESFAIDNVFLGGSLQLPLYSYSLISKPKEKLVSGYQFAGFGIQHIFLKKPSKKNNVINEDSIRASLTLGGLSSVDEDYLKSIDTTFFKENGKMNKHGKYVSASYPFVLTDPGSVIYKYNYTYADLFYDAIKAATTNLDRIYDGDYQIAPVLEKKNGNTFCTFCKFRDVCYRSLADIRDVSHLIKEKFASSDEESEDGEDESL